MNALGRLRKVIGLCSQCWRPSSLNAAVQGFDDNDQPTGPPTNYALCGKHARKWAKAMMSGPHEGSATYESGTVVSWKAGNHDDGLTW